MSEQDGKISSNGSKASPVLLTEEGRKWLLKELGRDWKTTPEGVIDSSGSLVGDEEILVTYAGRSVAKAGITPRPRTSFSSFQQHTGGLPQHIYGG